MGITEVKTKKHMFPRSGFCWAWARGSGFCRERGILSLEGTQPALAFSNQTELSSGRRLAALGRMIIDLDR